MEHPGSALWHGVKVAFAGENGAGDGVRREWFTLLAAELTNPDAGATVWLEKSGSGMLVGCGLGTTIGDCHCLRTTTDIPQRGSHCQAGGHARCGKYGYPEKLCLEVGHLF